MASDDDIAVRACLYRLAAELGRLPSASELAAFMRLADADVMAALRRLDEQRLVVIDRESCAIRMAHPLAGFETTYHFEAAGKRYHANCAWDLLALPPLLGIPGTAQAVWTDSGSKWRASASPETFDSPGGVVHFSVSSEQFWDNIGHT